MIFIVKLTQTAVMAPIIISTITIIIIQLTRLHLGFILRKITIYIILTLLIAP